MTPKKDKPQGARYWARRWGVYHNTARRLLAYLHRNYGSKVAWKVGRQKALVATEASLQVVSVLRTGKNVILVLGPSSGQADPSVRQRHDRRGGGEDCYITEDQFQRALGELRRELDELRRGKSGGPGVSRR